MKHGQLEDEIGELRDRHGGPATCQGLIDQIVKHKRLVSEPPAVAQRKVGGQLGHRPRKHHLGRGRRYPKHPADIRHLQTRAKPQGDAVALPLRELVERLVDFDQDFFGQQDCLGKLGGIVCNVFDEVHVHRSRCDATPIAPVPIDDRSLSDPQ